MLMQSGRCCKCGGELSMTTPKPQTPHCEDCDPSFLSCWNDGAKCCKKPDARYKPQTPLTDSAIRNILEAHDGDTESDFNNLGNVARSIELKLQEAEAKLEVESLREKCVVCNQLYSPSLVESSHCIFCIAKGFKETIQIQREHIAEAERQRDEALELLSGDKLSPIGLLWQRLLKAETENAQLIKVVDEAVVALELNRQGMRKIAESEDLTLEECAMVDVKTANAIYDHSLLPHVVQAKKGK